MNLPWVTFGRHVVAGQYWPFDFRSEVLINARQRNLKWMNLYNVEWCKRWCKEDVSHIKIFFNLVSIESTVTTKQFLFKKKKSWMKRRIRWVPVFQTTTIPPAFSYLNLFRKGNQRVYISNVLIWLVFSCHVPRSHAFSWKSFIVQCNTLYRYGRSAVTNIHYCWLMFG